jgi:23S rRNA pseudouridine2604 synthase
MDPRGLVILSEDGVLAQAVIGPGSRLEKEYRVAVMGDPTDEKIDLLRQGLELDERLYVVRRFGTVGSRFWRSVGLVRA